MSRRMDLVKIRNYWLFKSEPISYSFSDLFNEEDQTAEWDGVRNYQARNLLRDTIKPGDGILFYHSSSDPLGIVGIAEVMRGGYPDYTSWDSRSDHFDPKSSPENPIWYMVDIKAKEWFPKLVSRDALKFTPGLENMMLLRRGARLSIQPVTSEEWGIILSIAEIPDPL